MNLWDSVGAAVGIGACRVQIGLKTPVVGWRETARGRLTAVGGRVPQRITEAHVSLVEHWITVVMVGRTPVTQHHFRSHDEAFLDRDFVVAPGEQREWEFALTAPWAGDFSRHWFVGARLAIPGAVDARAKQDFQLIAPPVFRRIAAVLAGEARMPVRSWHLCGQGARAELKPEGDVRQILDGVRLEIFLNGSEAAGRVVVNPQERSVGDVVRSLVHADRRPLPFSFGANDLDSARAVFEEALRPHLDDLRALPLPSPAGPAAPEELPIPSD